MQNLKQIAKNAKMKSNAIVKLQNLFAHYGEVGIVGAIEADLGFSFENRYWSGEMGMDKTEYELHGYNAFTGKLCVIENAIGLDSGSNLAHSERPIMNRGKTLAELRNKGYTHIVAIKKIIVDWSGSPKINTTTVDIYVLRGAQPRYSHIIG